MKRDETRDQRLRCRGRADIAIPMRSGEAFPLVRALPSYNVTRYRHADPALVLQPHLRHRAFLWGEHVRNVRLAGGGTIDGQRTKWFKRSLLRGQRRGGGGDGSSGMLVAAEASAGAAGAAGSTPSPALSSSAPSSFNRTLAYQAIIEDAYGTVGAGRRKGNAEYMQYGYIPTGRGIGDEVSATLNYALADRSMSLAARAMGDAKNADALHNRRYDSAMQVIYSATHSPRS